MTATIRTTEKTIIVTGDYNSGFVAAANRLAGTWERPNWVFDIRNEDAVRAACMEHYGTDGRVTDQVDVRVTIPNGEHSEIDGRCCPITLFGRTVARAFGRDSGAKLGDGVVLEAGGFGSGGSMKNWRTTAKDGTTFVLRDVSRPAVERLMAETEAFEIEIIGATGSVDQDALIAERQALIARIEEIDGILSGANA